MADPFRTPVFTRRNAMLAASILLPIVALLGVAVARGYHPMPGRSFDGPPPPLDDDERALVDELRADVTALVQNGERSPRRLASLEAAARHVEDELARAGLLVRREPVPAGSGTEVDNVIADVGAYRPGHLLIGAHYDSAAGSPGGNDNASGVAVMLALARRPPAGGVRFVAFVDEEPPYFHTPRMGSRVYADHLAAQGALPGAVVVFDSVGFYRDAPGSQHYPGVRFADDRGRFVAFVGDHRSAALLTAVVGEFRARATLPSEGAVLDADVMGASWSDHSSFWRHDVPAILVTDTAAFRDPHYHQPSDDGAQIDYEALARLTSALEPCVRGALPR